MAARTALVVSDRAATPVAHTFTPDGDDTNGVAVFVEKTGLAIGDKKATLSLRRSNDKIRPSIRFAIPVVVTQTINGVSQSVVDRTAYAELNFTFDAGSTPQERKDIVGFLYNSLAPTGQTMVNDMIVNYENIW